jgi:IclR family transcriptional regulator, acetate operon repressor
MSAPDIGAELGLTRQTVHRFIQQLEEVRLVRRDMERERYDVGPALVELGLKALMNSHDAQLRRVVMDRLVAKVRETSNLGVLDGYEVVYIDRVECDWPLRLQITVGGRMPAYCTAIGKLLLAHAPAGRTDAYLALSPLERLTPNTICDPDAFRGQLAEIRERGYALNNQEDIEGLLGIAAPVHDASGTVIAGLSLHGPTVRMPEHRAKALVPELMEAAAEIGKLMRGSA